MMSGTKLGSLLRELFRWNHGPDAEFVGIGNLGAALAVGVSSFIWLALSPAVALILAISTFVLLTLFLLSPYTSWISALAGGSLVSVGFAVVLSAFGAALFGKPGLWLGAALGFIGGIALGVRSYSNVIRAARRR